MTATTELAARLEQVVPAGQLCGDTAERETFAIYGRAPEVIARPHSAEEVAEVVKFAIVEKLGVLACGSRSKLEMGLPPQRYDIALDMKGLKAIAHYDAKDLTLSVDAGMELRELENRLAAERQFLPLAVPCFETSTIGGAVASGIDSSLRQQYGTSRDFLIGAEFVDGAGKLCKSGGRVVKNVTGYDLHKLLIGSLGTLAAITRLNFRTFPLPETHAGFLASFRNTEQALGFYGELQRSGLPLSDVELLAPDISGHLVDVLQKGTGGAPPELARDGWNLYAAFEGNEAIVKRMTSELQRRSQAAGAKYGEALDAGVDANLGGLLREAFDWLRWASPAAVILRFALPDLGGDGLIEILEMASECQVPSAFLFRARQVGYLTLLGEGVKAGEELNVRKLVERISKVVAKKDGSASLLHAPFALRQSDLERGKGRGDFAMMNRVKQSFDLNNVFGPGRFLGGI